MYFCNNTPKVTSGLVVFILNQVVLATVKVDLNDLFSPVGIEVLALQAA